ncbi:hypothetical protein FRC12_020616 [Ceratobasidium sp. 428]|nr:hypothetical protein FRC12_020616 [Ceratobasidium sp. 428]
MSESESPTYSIDRVPFMPSYKRYSLTMLERLDPRASVSVRATPAANIEGYEIEFDADKDFNLSFVIGNDNGALIWGRGGFEKTVENIRIELDDETNERILFADATTVNGEIKTAQLNLDKYLDIVEYVDETSREVKRRLGEKPSSSKVSGT